MIPPSVDLSSEEIFNIINAMMPSFDPADYTRVIFGQTFTSTLKIGEGWDNTLIINCTFRDIEGHGIELRDASNVVIYDNSFSNISGTAVRFRSSGSTEDCAVISNDFDNIGLNAISAAKRIDTGVDHKDLLIHGNNIHDTGQLGDQLHHGIYVQTSGAVISSNTITGEVGGNAISIRGDGTVWNNSINVTSSDPWGSGIKYYSDNQTGPSKTLAIFDNVIDGNNNLYSGIEVKWDLGSIPQGVAQSDWLVNDYNILRNSVSNVRFDYMLDERIADTSWSTVLVEDNLIPAGPDHQAVSDEQLSILDPTQEPQDLVMTDATPPAYELVEASVEQVATQLDLVIADPLVAPHEPSRIINEPVKSRRVDNTEETGTFLKKVLALIARIFGGSKEDVTHSNFASAAENDAGESRTTLLSDLVPTTGSYDEAAPPDDEDEDDNVYGLAAW